MTAAKKTKIALALLASTALAGCLGSSTGGGAVAGGGGGATGAASSSAAEFQAQFDRVTGLIPTSDMPTSLQGSYSGELYATVTDASQVTGEVLADVNLDVNWTDGQTTNPFSGGASNFRGRTTGGDLTPISGSLTVDTNIPGTIARVDNPATTIGGFTVPATQTGAMSVTLSGQLTADETVDATVLLGGNFFGPGATAAQGVVSGGFSDANSSSPSIFDGSVAGQFYIERN
jgi:hypothetical protein